MPNVKNRYGEHEASNDNIVQVVVIITGGAF